MEYTLRNPQASDLFVVTKILKTIGLNNIKNAVDNDELKALREKAKHENEYVDEKGNLQHREFTEEQIKQSSMVVMTSIGDLLLDKADLVQDDLYKFISNLSGLKINDVKSMGIVDFANIVSDILHMPDFADFIKVVLKSIK